MSQQPDVSRDRVWNALVDGAKKHIAVLVRQATETLTDEVQELRGHIRELERRGPALVYRGVWKAGSAYTAGDATTDHGGLWCCVRDTTARPGTTGDWQLAVKKGGAE